MYWYKCVIIINKYIYICIIFLVDPTRRRPGAIHIYIYKLDFYRDGNKNILQYIYIYIHTYVYVYIIHPNVTIRVGRVA